jgi:hypothetical protein
LVLDSHHICPSPTPSPLAPSFFTHNLKLGVRVAAVRITSDNANDEKHDAFILCKFNFIELDYCVQLEFNSNS